jgi:hypothetical protein
MGRGEGYTGFGGGKPGGGGKRPLSRLRVDVDNVKMGLQEIGCGSVDWIDLALD